MTTHRQSDKSSAYFLENRCGGVLIFKEVIRGMLERTHPGKGSYKMNDQTEAVAFTHLQARLAKDRSTAN